MLELIHCFVEVLDKHFGQVCELDIMNEPEIVGGGSIFFCVSQHVHWFGMAQPPKPLLDESLLWVSWLWFRLQVPYKLLP